MAIDISLFRARVQDRFVDHEPVHVHDRDHCVFIKNGTGGGEARDWWLCPPTKYNPSGTLIARFGEAGDYRSFPIQTILMWGTRPGMEFGGVDPESFVQQGKHLLAELGYRLQGGNVVWS